MTSGFPPRRSERRSFARCASALGVMLAGAGSASGQAGWNIQFIFAPGQTEITPRTPSCTVRLSARFSINDIAVAGVRLDCTAGDGEWSGPRLIPPMTTGGNAGVIAGSSVTGIVGGQLHFPSAGIFADPSNPIMVWEATWTATNFTGRSVAFGTWTNRFDVYCNSPAPGWCEWPSRMNGLVEGAAELPVASCQCYADCDTNTGCLSLDIFDFLCFQNRYSAGDPYACDCDTGTGVGVCDILDFVCFQNAFAAGCP